MTGNLASSRSRVEVIKDDEDDPLPAENEEGPQVRVRDVFGGWLHRRPEHSGVSSVDVEHYIHDKSFRQRVILLSLRNSKIGIRLLFLRFVLKLIGCLLYVTEVVYFDYFKDKKSLANATVVDEIETLILLDGKPWALWAVQVLVGIIILIIAIGSLYAVSGWSLLNLWRILDFNVVIRFCIGGLYAFTLFYPMVLRNLFIPSFLLCWPARRSLTVAIVQLTQRSAQFRYTANTFRGKIIDLFIFLICFVFTWICLLHHFERIGNQLTLFDTYWFVIITISTVGYGDIAPTHWTGKLLVTVFIIAALIYLIPQLEEIYAAFQLQQKLHNSVSYTQSVKHIAVCSTHIKPLVLRDFLTEFYADPSHYDVHCVVMVENEFPSSILVYLSHPVWARRITVLIGSPHRQADLARARTQSAIACFLHTARHETDPETADQHTILSAWAIKDYAPDCKLYVQILKPENKMYLDMADSVVCEGELTTALLANQSLCPGTTTLMTLLLHTFKPEQCFSFLRERALMSDDYKLYSQCAPCEIYDSRLGESKYFHHFAGKNFLYTAVVAYRKYQVTLLGVRSKHSEHILINPGLHHIMEEDDICYYIGFTKEEYSIVHGVSNLQTALSQVCAELAVIALSMSAIDPLELNEHNEAAHDEVDHPNGHPLEPFHHVDTHASSLGVPSTNTQEGNRQNEARRGLQLLRFHSKVDLHARPVVKVNLAHQRPSSPLKTELYRLPEEDFEDSCHISPSQSHLTLQLDKLEKGRKVSPTKRGLDRVAHSDYQQSFSEGMVEGVSPLKTGQLYSSLLELVPSPTSSIQFNMSDGVSSPTRHSPTLQHWSSAWSAWSHDEEEVVLELANLAEEEELEELEDGFIPEGVPEDEASPRPSLSSEPIQSCARIRYKKGLLPVSPYCGCEPFECHLLSETRQYSQIRLDQGKEHEEMLSHWQQGAVIAYCEKVVDDLYHFILPLRAHYLPPGSLKPIVIMLEKEPSSDFLDSIASLPMVYYLLGSLSNVNDWLRAGILLAENVAIIGSPTVHQQDQHEHMVDATHIMATQKLSKLFPNVNIITELHYRYNIRFMKFTVSETYMMRNLSALTRRTDHLTYLFVPQFAAGKAFCSSMLDTILYQAHVKPYIVDVVRQMLGCKQVENSGFLWKVKMTDELLKLQTYDRLFQRLASHHQIPLGIYRSVPIDSCPEIKQMSSRRQPMDSEGFTRFLNSRMQSLGLKTKSPTHSPSSAHQFQSFVLPNPPPKTELKHNDVILVLRQAPRYSEDVFTTAPTTTIPPSQPNGNTTTTIPPSQPNGNTATIPPSQPNGNTATTIPPSQPNGNTTTVSPSQPHGNTTTVPPSQPDGNTATIPPSQPNGNSTSQPNGSTTTIPPSQTNGKNTDGAADSQAKTKGPLLLTVPIECHQ